MKKRNDSIRNYDVILQKHIDKKDCIKICRTFNGREEDIDGIILSANEYFLLIQVVYDFTFDGYAIIKKTDFDSIRFNKNNRAYSAILKREGLLDEHYGIDIEIDMSNWQTIFGDLRKNDLNVIIEREDLEEPFFDIGPIKRIAKKSVSIQYHNPEGILENKLTPLKYDDITIVKFGDKYSTIYKKYLRTK